MRIPPSSFRLAALLPLFAVAADAQITETQLTTGATDQRPSWSPDGFTILFDSDRSGNKDIWSVPAAGGSVTQITLNSLVDQHPDWAPGSAMFVYSANAGAGTDLYVRPISGGPSVLLDADSTAADLFPAWSPDSLSIAYEKGGDIYVIPSAGGTPMQLTTDPARDSHPSWSPDGSRIVFRSDRNGNDDLFLIPSGGGALTQLTFDPTDDNGPDWSPNGDLIAFASFRSGTRDVWMMPDSGGTATRLTFSGYDEGEPDWAPSGQEIAFTRFGAQGLFIISFPLVDVAVTQTADVTSAPVFSTVNYTVTVTNHGPEAASGVEVTDLLPAGLTYQSSTVTTGTYNSGTGVWTVGSQAVSAVDTLTIAATIDPGTAGQMLTTTAKLTALDQIDGHKDNQVPSVDVTATGVDLAVTKDVDNQTPAEGATINYLITLTNIGTDPTTNVEVSDVIPSGLSYQSSAATRGTYSPGLGNWSVDSCLVGVTDSLTITCTVQTGTTGNTITNTATMTVPGQVDTDPSNDSDAVAIVPGAIDLGLSQIVNDPTPDEGDTSTFTVTLTNHGSMVATGIEVTDLLPAGITYSGDAPTRGSYASGTGIWMLDSLGIGASEDLALSGSVDPGTAGQTLTNTATVTLSDQIDPVGANDTSAVGVTVTAVDLAVTKKVDDATPAEAAAIQYEVVVRNLGPDVATGVEVTDPLPAGVTYGSDTATTGAYSSGTGVWSIGSMAVGAADTLLIDATVDAGTAGQLIANTAFRSATDQGDLSAANDTSTVNILVGALDLSLAMSVTNSFPNGGETISYEIALMNMGPNPASGLQVTDLLPAELTYQSDVATQGAYTPGTGVWDVGSMSAGASDTLTISAVVTASPGAAVPNTASITALDQIDTNSGDDSRTIQITVGAMVTEAQLTSSPTDRRPAWAPNGTMMLFDSDRAGNKDIWSIPLPIGSGSAVKRTANLLLDEHPDWAPSGPKYVYSANAGAGTDLYIGSIAPGVPAVLLDADPSSADLYPSWSPDSLFIAYEKQVGAAAGDIYVIPSTGGTPVQLTSDPAPDSHPSWSPDGTQIVFRSTRSGNEDLWIVPASGGTPVQLTTDPASDLEPDWSPTGNLIAFSSLRTGNRDIFVIPSTGGAAVQMTTSPLDDNQPDWSPTGDALAIVRLGGQGLYILSFPVADIDVSKTVDVATPGEGAVVTYTISARNLGTAAATGLRVTDALPAGLTFQSASATAGTYSSLTGAWDVGGLAAGGADTLTITATVDSATSGQTITNVARVTVLDQLDANTANDADSVDIDVTAGAVSVQVPGISPITYSLANGRPTPFRNDTRIRFDIATPGLAVLSVFDVTGRRVRGLVHETLDVGRYTVAWDGRDDGGARVAAGVYFVRLRAGDFTATRKSVLLR